MIFNFGSRELQLHGLTAEGLPGPSSGLHCAAGTSTLISEWSRYMVEYVDDWRVEGFAIHVERGDISVTPTFPVKQKRSRFGFLVTTDKVVRPVAFSCTAHWLATATTSLSQLDLEVQKMLFVLDQPVSGLHFLAFSVTGQVRYTSRNNPSFSTAPHDNMSTFRSRISRKYPTRHRFC